MKNKEKYMPGKEWSPWVSAKFIVFRLLEFLSGILNKKSSDSICTTLQLPADNGDENSTLKSKYVWIYVSTIGELNAISPFIKDLMNENAGEGLVLMTDHLQYTQSFQWQYPEAHIIFHGDSAQGIESLLTQYPPKIFFISEIPCKYSDAPCRFSFRVIYEVKKYGVPICVVNGWLYNGDTSCRMDEIESRLFSNDYLQAIDLFLVQTEEVSRVLVDKGVNESKVHVTGNIKFDALALEPSWSIGRSKSPKVLQKIIDSGRPCIVAGCVAETDEAIVILKSFQYVRKWINNALLVFAPRHPENEERMIALIRHINDMEFCFIKKSEWIENDLTGVDIVIVDTIGELRDFYAISSVSYVGMNHNILEPLMYNKPVVILPGWEASYPTFPVYKKLTEMSAITEVADVTGDKLGAAFVMVLNSVDDDVNVPTLRDQLVSQLSGAANRDMELVNGLLPGIGRK